MSENRGCPSDCCIRVAGADDYEQIVDIWLRASRRAHDFVPEAFWLERAPEMRKRYLPAAENYLLRSHGRTCGFVSLVDDHLAALFVDPAAQRRGHGRRLLGFVQGLRKALTLCVYSRNVRAVAFYRAAGFVTVTEHLDAETRQTELLLAWRK